MGEVVGVVLYHRAGVGYCYCLLGLFLRGRSFEVYFVKCVEGGGEDGG